MLIVENVEDTVRHKKRKKLSIRILSLHLEKTTVNVLVYSFQSFSPCPYVYFYIMRSCCIIIHILVVSYC